MADISAYPALSGDTKFQPQTERFLVVLLCFQECMIHTHPRNTNNNYAWLPWLLQHCPCSLSDAFTIWFMYFFTYAHILHTEVNVICTQKVWLALTVVLLCHVRR